MDILEEVDIEEFTKAGRPVPPAKRYRIRVDKDLVATDNATPTGREILDLVKKKPETHILAQKMRGAAPRVVQPDEPVDLRAPGVERFVTTPRDSTEGALDAA